MIRVVEDPLTETLIILFNLAILAHTLKRRSPRGGLAYGID